VRWQIQWRDDALNAAADERATVADFALWVGEVSATTHIIEGDREVHEDVTVALCHVANALAHRWWEIFGGRDRWFRLMPHRGGYALPDIQMTFDGAAFEIESHQYAYRNPKVRFWEAPRETLPREDAESQLSRLVEQIIERLNECGVRDSSPSLRWSRVRNSIADPDETVFCEAAGALGADPYQIEDSLAAVIERSAEVFRSEALMEFLAGARRVNVEVLIDWIRAAERRSPYCARISDLRAVGQAAAAKAPSHPGEPGWSLGYRRARAVRQVISAGQAGQDERFVGFRSLAERLGASRHYQLAREIDGLRALRTDLQDATYIHMRQHGARVASRAAHTFTFARAVGDAVCFPEHTDRSPVNDLHSAYRQAAGRAFAAELLAPIDEIRSMREDGHDEVSMAEEFGVSTAVIEHQIENESRILEAVSGGDGAQRGNLRGQ
jgi:hypothetical protein